MLSWRWERVATWMCNRRELHHSERARKQSGDQHAVPLQVVQGQGLQGHSNSQAPSGQTGSQLQQGPSRKQQLPQLPAVQVLGRTWGNGRQEGQDRSSLQHVKVQQI